MQPHKEDNFIFLLCSYKVGISQALEPTLYTTVLYDYTIRIYYTLSGGAKSQALELSLIHYRTIRIYYTPILYYHKGAKSQGYIEPYTLR